jgi:hypothetical protein
VYSAFDHCNQTWYAVKALSKTNANGEPSDRRQREFQSREIQLHYAASEHPNPVSMLKILDGQIAHKLYRDTFRRATLSLKSRRGVGLLPGSTPEDLGLGDYHHCFLCSVLTCVIRKHNLFLCVCSVSWIICLSSPRSYVAELCLIYFLFNDGFTRDYGERGIWLDG